MSFAEPKSGDGVSWFSGAPLLRARIRLCALAFNAPGRWRHRMNILDF
jgi:hypothetical protein